MQMENTLASVGLFCVLLVGGFGSHCPCENKELCHPINDTAIKEVFVFSKNPGERIWRQYDWDKMTTIVVVGFVSSSLMCFAHEHNVRIVSVATFQKSDLANSTLIEEWIEKQISHVKRKHLDGINIDFEQPIPKNQPLLNRAFTDMVRLTNEKFKEEMPSSQVTVDVAWSPNCIDRRCYDYAALAEASDFLFVMSYDHRSQIFERCVAGANSGYYKAQKGLEDYLALGIPAEKLVLGLPWYGMKYPCLEIDDSDVCSIRYVSFLGAFCSQKAGTQKCFSDIYPLADESASGRMWDNRSLSPYFIHTDPYAGQTFQFWYDDPESLSSKFGLASRLGLRGVGVWRADCLDYSDKEEALAITDKMWDAIPTFHIHDHESSSPISFVFN
ncbi:di-N-acetylchitobiase-like [Gigantopelta aegis]|uniref:di-N-acetylchitobiase-like n=1 Tax=Gigantopelta aegis TaxID=1735272 RepID=UPI001B8889CA|nr:di-N-acetylchitobiase-like [Gigantopelta aegis]